MPSFDIVSEVNEVEVRNALDQSNKELGTRFGRWRVGCMRLEAIGDHVDREPGERSRRESREIGRGREHRLAASGSRRSHAQPTIGERKRAAQNHHYHA